MDVAKYLSLVGTHRLTYMALIFSTFLGTLLFSSGFLKVRRVLEHRSRCDARAVEPLFISPNPGGHGCWVPVDKKKFVLLVVDALRLDFVLPPKRSAPDVAWGGKLSIMAELARTQPDKAQIFRFIADPPTVTTQRLSSIAGGNLPTFVEVAENFSGSSALGDNFVSQLLRSELYRKFYFFGDDTWTSLFPEIEQISTGKIAGYHSFHLFDLNSVDDGIKTDLIPALQENDYNVLVAHFLGLDHCGHKYGPGHELCGAKLAELNQVIQQVISHLDNDTTLFVFGDHGMTDSGDHGGISEKEISAALFAFSRSGFIVEGRHELLRRVQETRMEVLNLDPKPFYCDSYDDSVLKGTVAQIDFAPTLSILAGVPIPFNNLGAVIPELLPGDQKYLLDVIRINAFQVSRMIEANSQSGQQGFDLKSIRSLQEKLAEAEQHVRSGGDLTDEQLVDSYIHFQSYLIATQNHCRRVWADYDYHLIILGLFVAVISVLALGWRLRDALSGLSLLVSFLHAFALGSLGFVVFEDALVRYLLAFMIVSCGMYYGAFSPSQMLFMLLTVRLGANFGVCREEQYPFCQVSSHRSLTFSYDWAIGAILLVAIAGLAFSWHRLTKFKSRRSKWAFATAMGLLLVHWVWTWASDTASIAESDLLSIQLPRVLYLSSFAMLMAFRKDQDLFMGSFAILAGIVQRPVAGWVLVATAPSLLQGASLITDDKLAPYFYYVVGMFLFFVTGHQATITSLQWEAAFIGVRETNQVLSGVLVTLNTFAGPFLATIAFAGRRSTMKASLTYIWISLVQFVCTTVVAAALLRHLMLWKVFTPRFLLQGLLTCGTSLVLPAARLLLGSRHKL